jgi:D-hexose-6-phosphate mutarotase
MGTGMHFRSRQHQRGATLLGILTILAILGFGLYGGIRLTPLYLEYMKVVKAMNQTASEAKGDETSPAALRAALDRRWSIEDIERLDVKDIEITKVANGFEMHAQYRAEAPFLSNVSLVVDFDKTVEIKK